MTKSKFCYILPEYDAKIPTHFAHLYDFIKEAAKIFDIFLLIEKGEKPDLSELGVSKIYRQKFKFFPLRIAENFFILKLARFRGYKNFYVHYSFVSAFNASLITKFLGGKVFYWNCGLPWNYKRSFWRNFFEKLTYRLINFLVTGTESLKIEYAKHYKIPLDKIKVMPNWINLKNFQFFHPAPIRRGGLVRDKIFNFQSDKLKKELNIQNQKIILFVHRLSRRKGAHYLPEILNRLNDENIILLIIGDGPEKRNLEFRIQDLGLSDKVRFLGWVPNKEIYNYYGIADVFIMPSEEEGFPRVLLEAMAMEVPFVAYDVGGVKEIIPPEFLDFIAKIGDVETFSLKIKELLNLPKEKLEELKSIEKNWVQKYDLIKAIDIFNEIVYNIGR